MTLLFKFEHKVLSIVEFYRKMVDFKYGTGFGYLIEMKMKFSHKDILILVGIVVAVIITLTTLVFRDGKTSLPKTTGNNLKPNTSLYSPSSVLKKAIDRISFVNPL